MAFDITALTTIRELVTPNNFDVLRNVFASAGKTLYAQDGISVGLLELYDSWVLLITGPKDADMKFGELQHGDNIVFFGTRYGTGDTGYVTNPKLERGEWFEVILLKPDEQPIRFPIQIAERLIELAWKKEA